MTTPPTLPTPAPTAPAAEALPPPAVSRRLVAVLAMVVLAIAGVGYAVKGTPDYAALLAAAEAQQARAAAAAASMPSPEQLDVMVGKLVEHLQKKPEDGEGWTMLGRARALQGRLDDAVAAYARAAALRTDDVRLLIDYAELLGLKNNRSLAGEPAALLERALALDPGNPKGLALAGAAAFDAKQYARAVQHWERLVALSDPQAGYLVQVNESIAEARRLGGLPAAAGAAAAGATAAASAAVAPSTPLGSPPGSTPGGPTAAATVAVRGTVSLSPALAAQARPEDTLFIFARAAQGPRMPIAILKKQVRELPLAFTLDDTMAMSPAMTLAKAGEVVVVARISRSGQAAPQPGDLFGESAPIKPAPAGAAAAAGLTLVIDQAVRQTP